MIYTERLEFKCCECCLDERRALSDHVDHGGWIEKDGHEMPCDLHQPDPHVAKKGQP